MSLGPAKKVEVVGRHLRLHRHPPVARLCLPAGNGIGESGQLHLLGGSCRNTAREVLVVQAGEGEMPWELTGPSFASLASWC